MSALAILTLIQSLAGAIPELSALIQGISGAGNATPASVLAILQKYGIDRAVFAANIAVAEAAGK